MSDVDIAPGGPLRGLVHACLDDLDELVDDFIAELSAIEPYASGAVPNEELREDAEASIEMLLRTVAGLPVPQRIGDTGERIGRRRAHLGVPLEVLLRAVRLDFRVMWSAFLRRVDRSELPLLVHNTVRVWDVVEEYSARVHLAYEDEAAVLAREREDERNRLVDSLLAGGGRDPQFVEQVARALGMNANGDFLVAAAPVDAPRPLRQAADRLRAASVPAHLQDVDRRQVLIAELPNRSPGTPARWLDSVPCGVGPIANGLADVRRAVRISVAVAATISGEDGRPHNLVEQWPHVVGARLGEIAAALRDEVLPAPAAGTPHERARMLETVRAYLRSGSINAVANEVFCHRNTVLNRLHRFAELTGHDVTRPEHAAAVLVALACRDRADGEADPG
ncbi:PucR C-terminal helix-turn-helix domain-containing protein [Saccharopolyspora shandongensis]|uniref:PucR C-terminal helix-turn-helix domain-containing protein n=1 Tax=Saccharopolyspora shandongensis TaxID=418495 RepID=A0A1H3DFP2_9PSEU|nr:helix-turn-helix domain-containing protein [Saccharopolyspora shandongensis]SDX64958.1 PucR C-terminal helix-turn-helix domain-containing protein [Saccharopolyspora shandongensis]